MKWNKNRSWTELTGETWIHNLWFNSHFNTKQWNRYIVLMESIAWRVTCSSHPTFTASRNSVRVFQHAIPWRNWNCGFVKFWPPHNFRGMRDYEEQVSIRSVAHSAGRHYIVEKCSLNIQEKQATRTQIRHWRYTYFGMSKQNILFLVCAVPIMKIVRLVRMSAPVYDSTPPKIPQEHHIR